MKGHKSNQKSRLSHSHSHLAVRFAISRSSLSLLLRSREECMTERERCGWLTDRFPSRVRSASGLKLRYCPSLLRRSPL
ncbi:hypothetical protein PMAYCL1PPCAC_25772 [Pristionchus mayeri]|uniref:Uncharacterized protein n=1 Tax=Pristionchus mayeri TaxID=1317129 RepID=A0AAN5D3U0_9BILA|nr:hypothetical protein PMAYCL1PPCAC_25772 [Pristionchus mayeri]